MNVIFVTVSRVHDIKARGIYTDLMRKFRDEGHNVYVVSPVERQFGLPTSLREEDGVHILNVRTLNIQKTNVIEKGLGTVLLETQYKRAIKKHLRGVAFDLILYSTPPITTTNVVKYLKRRNPKAITYLLLKDIFPQNAVDVGMFAKTSPFHWYFRAKEKALYKATDYIGCMSPANVDFVLKHNDFVNKDRVEIAPNSIELKEEENAEEDRKDMATKIKQQYNLPIDRPIFIYGGNLGKPQGIPYLIQCLDANAGRKDCHFIVVGDGTEYARLDTWYKEKQPSNVSLFARLPKEDYDMLVQSCDVGLIFLDHRFTIPNYPSRLLSYLEYKMPIIAATDVNTDVGSIAEANGYGYWCESVNPEDFTACVDRMLSNDMMAMGEKGYQYLKENYLVTNTYDAIVKHLC